MPIQKKKAGNLLNAPRIYERWLNVEKKKKGIVQEYYELY